MMSSSRASMLVLVLLVGCGNRAGSGPDAAVDAGYVPDACEGLHCFQFDCGSKGLPPTSLSGTVFAPNGTLPLYGVNVYVPISDPGPLPEGATCDRCDAGLPGGALVQARTDEAGQFVLDNVPATTDVPLVIQIGKWRRQLVIPKVAACEDQPLAPTETRLPKNSMEGDLPRIAISTGSADALECLPLKLGVDPSEISASTGTGRIHLFTNPDNTNGAGQGASTFRAGWEGGTAPMTRSTLLWSDLDNLKAYDMVFLSCEGNQRPETKPLTSLETVRDYADLGGRVFASHWHNIWIGGRSNGAYGLADWQATADFNFSGNPSPDTLTATIDEVSNPKGMAFATWMLNVMGSTTRGLLTVTQARKTVTSVVPDKAEQWVYLDPVTSPNYGAAMNYQFTTPQSVPEDQRCGKVVFSDMHVSADSSSRATTPYPNGCSANPLTAQEKALAFMFFDIASCVGVIL
jgi:hypothetical protein